MLQNKNTKYSKLNENKKIELKIFKDKKLKQKINNHKIIKNNQINNKQKEKMSQSEQIQQFNSLLFNEETKVLESITQNLAYDSNDEECQKNSFVLFEYFRINNKLPQLISFTLRQQLLSTENGSLMFKENGIFTTFLSAYVSAVYPHLNNSLKLLFQSVDTILENMDLNILKHGLSFDSSSGNRSHQSSQKKQSNQKINSNDSNNEIHNECVDEMSKNDFDHQIQMVEEYHSSESMSSGNQSDGNETNVNFLIQIQNIMKALETLSKCQETMRGSLPSSFYFCFKIIFSVIDELLDYQDENNHIKLVLFNSILKMFYEMFLTNEKMLKIAVGKELFEKNNEKFLYTVNILMSLTKEDETTNDVVKECKRQMRMMNEMHQNNEEKHEDIGSHKVLFDTILNFSMEDYEKQKVEERERHEIIHNMIMMVKTNLLPIKKQLKADIGIQLYETLDISTSIVDDYNCYHKLTNHIQTFLKEYYIELYKKIDESERLENDFYEVRDEFINLSLQLEEKLRKNEELMKSLIELKREKGIVSEEDNEKRKKKAFGSKLLRNIYNNFSKDKKDSEREQRERELKKQKRQTLNENWKELIASKSYLTEEKESKHQKEKKEKKFKLLSPRLRSRSPHALKDTTEQHNYVEMNEKAEVKESHFKKRGKELSLNSITTSENGTNEESSLSKVSSNSSSSTSQDSNPPKKSPRHLKKLISGKDDKDQKKSKK